MKKCFVLSIFMLMFVLSCSTTPVVEPEPVVKSEPVVKPEPELVVEDKVTDADENMKFGYKLVPGMDLRETNRGVLLVLENPVNFKLREYNIQKQYDPSFKTVEEFVNSNSKTITRLIVEGHTDKTGRASPTNVELSKRRSLSSVEKLSNMGLSRTLMRSSGLGEAIPEYSGKNEYKNRRVEFIVMRDDADVKKYDNAVSKLNLNKNR